MLIVYTHHAEKQLVERELDRAWVERIVEGPAFQQPDPEDPELVRLFGPVPERGGRFLRVVVSFESEVRCRVVTVHLDRKARRRRR